MGRIKSHRFLRNLKGAFRNNLLTSCNGLHVEGRVGTSICGHRLHMLDLADQEKKKTLAQYTIQPRKPFPRISSKELQICLRFQSFSSSLASTSWGKANESVAVEARLWRSADNLQNKGPGRPKPRPSKSRQARNKNKASSKRLSCKLVSDPSQRCKTRLV